MYTNNNTLRFRPSPLLPSYLTHSLPPTQQTPLSNTQTHRQHARRRAQRHPCPCPSSRSPQQGFCLMTTKKGRASRRRRRTGEREKRARANKAGHVISFEGGTPPHTARGQAAGFSTTQPAVCPKCVLSLSSATPHLPPFALARCFSSFGEIRTTPSSSPSSSLLCFRPRKIHTQQQQAS